MKVSVRDRSSCCQAGKPTEACPGVRRRCDAFKNGRATASRYKLPRWRFVASFTGRVCDIGSICRYFAATRTRRHRFSESSNRRLRQTVASGTVSTHRSVPRRNRSWWQKKIEYNQQRDRDQISCTNGRDGRYSDFGSTIDPKTSLRCRSQR